MVLKWRSADFVALLLISKCMLLLLVCAAKYKVAEFVVCFLSSLKLCLLCFCGAKRVSADFVVLFLIINVCSCCSFTGLNIKVAIFVMNVDHL